MVNWYYTGWFLPRLARWISTYFPLLIGTILPIAKTKFCVEFQPVPASQWELGSWGTVVWSDSIESENSIVADPCILYVVPEIYYLCSKQWYLRDTSGWTLWSVYLHTESTLHVKVPHTGYQCTLCQISMYYRCNQCIYYIYNQCTTLDINVPHSVNQWIKCHLHC